MLSAREECAKLLRAFRIILRIPKYGRRIPPIVTIAIPVIPIAIRQPNKGWTNEFGK